MKTSRFGTGCTGTILVCALLTGSCVPDDPSVLDFAANDAEVRTPSLPERCRHLYNVGRHFEWAECMGVGYNHARRTALEMDGEITDIHLKLTIFDSERALQYALKTKGGCRDCDTTEGISMCDRDVAANKAECVVFMVRPKYIDDNATRVLGHEVEHGIYGRYHK